MKRTVPLFFGIVIGVLLTLLFQQGLKQYRLHESRIDFQIMEFAYKDFPRILYPPVIEPEGEFSEIARTLDATWMGTPEEGELTIVYEVPDGIKRVKMKYTINDGRAELPSEEAVKAVDAAASPCDVTGA